MKNSPHTLQEPGPNETVYVVSGAELLCDGRLKPMWKLEDLGPAWPQLIQHAVPLGASSWGIESRWLERLPGESSFKNLRSIYSEYSGAKFLAAARACHLVHWRRRTSFCGACGTRTEWVGTELALRCPDCGELFYPRIAPAVIIAITRQNASQKTEVLLARHLRGGKPSQNYGLIAGYVEPGESAEQAAEREIFEETGLSVRNLQYRYSQPWPFPDSLMLGYSAEFDSGTLQAQEDELAELGWFSADSLPSLPPKVSLSRQLTELVLGLRE